MLLLRFNISDSTWNYLIYSDSECEMYEIIYAWLENLIDIHYQIILINIYIKKLYSLSTGVPKMEPYNLLI